MNTHATAKFLNVDEAALVLGVPASWLKSEAKAGRIPYLPVGRRILFNVELVEERLLRRAEDTQTQCGFD